MWALIQEMARSWWRTGDGREKAPDSLKERLIAAMVDGVVPEELYAILAVGNEVDAPKYHWSIGPVQVSKPDLSGVVCGTKAPIQSLSVPSVTTGLQSEAKGSWGLII